MATPPFNLHDYNADEMPRFAQGVQVNVAVFGPASTVAVTRLMRQIDGMDDLSSVLGRVLPSSRYDDFVVRKARESVTEFLINNPELDGRLPRDGQQRLQRARERLRAFFESCPRARPASLEQWYAFVDRSLGGEQWRSPGALHVPSVLRLFGLEAHEAEAVAGTKFARADCAAAGEEQPGTRRPEKVWRALEWLGKALASGYGPPGATSDLVNLVFLLERSPPEAPVATVVEAFRARRLERGEVSDLELPLRMVQDGEFDDTLAWKLLHHLHRKRGSLDAFKVHMQLPQYSDLPSALWFESLATQLREAGVEPLIDGRSLNADKVRRNPMFKLNADGGAAPPPPSREPSGQHVG
eukprot:CAMPEP_0202735562 /NCGR_PEP_ID=MMETSP1388-20130828/475_1 /ASSEMBLY_ACC=CAM_ASM_000864 /TAXON_ID=37098 /ORGANISM="Isochrysis sp, Strain CCMP1244" /LENGTH=354 /DNA_ID=CAMNT_0049402009 /DNA_START=134 /DNA_END=1198 /DNA_ORIENTATION=+